MRRQARYADSGQMKSLPSGDQTFLRLVCTSEKAFRSERGKARQEKKKKKKKHPMPGMWEKVQVGRPEIERFEGLLPDVRLRLCLGKLFIIVKLSVTFAQILSFQMKNLATFGGTCCHRRNLQAGATHPLISTAAQWFGTDSHLKAIIRGKERKRKGGREGEGERQREKEPSFSDTPTRASSLHASASETKDLRKGPWRGVGSQGRLVLVELSS